MAKNAAFKRAFQLIEESEAFVRLPGLIHFNAFEFKLVNRSSNAAKFYISPGSIDLGSESKLIASILHPGMTDETKAKELWKFACAWSTYGFRPDEEERISPMMLYYSFHQANCEGINQSLTGLFALAGFQARTWALGGHVVSEVYYDSAWHMFDADREVYFLDGDGGVAGVEYISKHPECIEAGRDSMELWYGIPYSYVWLQNIFSSRHNNSLLDDTAVVFRQSDNSIILEKDDQLMLSMSKSNEVSQVLGFLSNRGFIPRLCEGLLTRSFQFADDIGIGNGGYAVSQKLPFAIEKVTVSHQGDVHHPLDLYYSTDSMSWYYAGTLDHDLSSIVINADREGIFQRPFAYFLRLSPDASTTPAATQDISLQVITEFLFSENLLLADDSLKMVFDKNAPANNLHVSIKGFGEAPAQNLP